MQWIKNCFFRHGFTRIFADWLGQKSVKIGENRGELLLQLPVSIHPSVRPG
jgi:hypothetical protein